MANITLGSNPVKTSGNLPAINTTLLDFKLVAKDFSTKTLEDFKGYHLILNIFPSINTAVCSTSVRAFNKSAANLDNTLVLCISRDLPFAQEKFCAAEGIENVIMLSDFKKGAFGNDYGLIMTDGIFESLLSRCIIIANTNNTIIYTEQVNEIGDEPNYNKALEALK